MPDVAVCDLGPVQRAGGVELAAKLAYLLRREGRPDRDHHHVGRGDDPLVGVLLGPPPPPSSTGPGRRRLIPG